MRPCPNLQSFPFAGLFSQCPLRDPHYLVAREEGISSTFSQDSVQREATADVYPWATSSTLELLSAQEDHTSYNGQGTEVCSTQEGILTPRNTAL